MRKIKTAMRILMYQGFNEFFRVLAGKFHKASSAAEAETMVDEAPITAEVETITDEAPITAEVETIIEEAPAIQEIPETEPFDKTKSHMKEVYSEVYKGFQVEYDEEWARSGTTKEDFELYGAIETAIVKYHGLKDDHHLVDVGCSTGRLAIPLSKVHPGKYSGYDIVKDAVDYAKKTVNREDWRFEEIEYISIPEQDKSVDMVCFFSVFTHLLHEQSY